MTGFGDSLPVRSSHHSVYISRRAGDAEGRGGHIAQLGESRGIADTDWRLMNVENDLRAEWCGDASRRLRAMRLIPGQPKRPSIRRSVNATACSPRHDGWRSDRCSDENYMFMNHLNDLPLLSAARAGGLCGGTPLDAALAASPCLASYILLASYRAKAHNATYSAMQTRREWMEVPADVCRRRERWQ